MEPTLDFIETLVRQAGDILRAGFGQRYAVTYKSVIDPVTEIDKRTEAFLLGEIRQHFPKHKIISEESGDTGGEGSFTWYVDPLDGTVNYTHGMPIYSVTVAFAKEGEILLGAVYDPTRDECFSAEKGRGARLNDEPIQVSEISDLDHSLLVTGFPYDIRINPDNNLNHFANFTLRTQAVRRLGSAALDLCYVAAGRFDGFWEIRLSPWDVAAGGLIAQEAGAIVTDLYGNPDFLSTPQSILAANPLIHSLMLRVLSNRT